MFDEIYNSPNGFTVHKYNENENVNESVKIRGTTMFQNKDDYYPDYEKYSNQGKQTWEKDTKESQDKLNEMKRTAEVSGTVINVDNNDVVDPNAFFNNNSQVYLFYNLGEKVKDGNDL